MGIHLRVCGLCQDGCHRVIVPSETMDLHLVKGKEIFSSVHETKEAFQHKCRSSACLTEQSLLVCISKDAKAEDHLSAHVPDSAHAVSASSHEYVQARMQRQRVDPAQVPMVLSDDLRV